MSPISTRFSPPFGEQTELGPEITEKSEKRVADGTRTRDPGNHNPVL